jgi:putative FmdB family regulatory protein
VPTYDYECQACGHRFELFQGMTAKVKRKCPECGKPKLERLIGPGAGFLFKGDGFYITDYRSDSYRQGQKAAEDSSKTPDATSDKPAAKSDAKSDGSASKKADSPPATKASKGKKSGT